MPTLDGQLVVAVDDGDVPGVESALRRGASVSATNQDTEQSVLAIAFSNGCAAIVRLLSRFGCDIDARPGNRGDTWLHAAAYARDGHPLLATLIELGARVNAADNDGWTALHLAAANGYATNVRLLVAGGADPFRYTRHGLTPGDLARINGHDEVLAELPRRS